MAAGDLISQAGQVEFNGLLMGVGTDFGIDKIEGLGLPALRAAEAPRDANHGLIVARPDLLANREIVVHFRITSASAAELSTNLDSWADALKPKSATEPFVFQLANWAKRRIYARCRRREFDWDLLTNKAHYVTGRAAFVAEDPRIYANAQTTTAVGASGTVTNAGTANIGVGSPDLILEVSGSYTNPVLTNTTDSSKAISLTVSGSSTITINVGQRTVTIGGVDEYDTVNGSTVWWELLEGANALTCSSGSLTVKHRDAWF